MDPGRADAARDDADVEFDFVAATRRIGQRKSARSDFLGQLQIDVLTGLEVERLAIVECAFRGT